MLYKCLICKKLKVVKKDTYQLIVNSSSGQLTKRLCDLCGDNFNQLVDQAEQSEGFQDVRED